MNMSSKIEQFRQKGHKNAVFFVVIVFDGTIFKFGLDKIHIMFI